MTDRELLELAAKAAGIAGQFYENEYGPFIAEKPPMQMGDLVYYQSPPWKPLTDDGDALRLAVKLQMQVQANEASAIVETWQSDEGETKEVIEYFDPPQDPYAATRRAIVRAAAEIGKAMP